MKGLVVVLASGLASWLLAGGLGWSDAGAARVAATRIDRTYACTVLPEYDDVRVVNFGIGPRRELSNGYTDPGRIGVSTEAAGELNTNLVSISTGPTPGQRPTSGSIVVTRKSCTEIKDVQIPLTPAGLPTPPYRYEKYVECRVPRRVLVRLRATVDRRPRFAADGRGNLVARTNITEAQLAVHSFSGKGAARKPLALGVFSKTGEITVWLAPTCE